MIDNELLTTDENGVIVGKNLEVDGKTKINGGLEVVAKYNEPQFTLIDFGTIETDGSGTWHILLADSEDGINICGIGQYTLSGQHVDSFGIVGYSGTDSCSIEMSYFENKITIETLAYDSTFDSLRSELQAKLFRHILVLNGKYYKEYLTDSNLVVDSIQDLNTITHAKNGTILVLGPELQCINQSGTWKIGAETLTTVSDTVETI